MPKPQVADHQDDRHPLCANEKRFSLVKMSTRNQGLLPNSKSVETLDQDNKMATMVRLNVKYGKK